MNKCEHTIGIMRDYFSVATLMTKNELVGHVEDKCSLYSLKDYCDRRRATNFQHFNYCPCCGQKIDWDKIREEIL